MIHRTRQWLTVEELQHLVDVQRQLVQPVHNVSLPFYGCLKSGAVAGACVVGRAVNLAAGPVASLPVVPWWQCGRWGWWLFSLLGVVSRVLGHR
jgi:hypothetical protein